MQVNIPESRTNGMKLTKESRAYEKIVVKIKGLSVHKPLQHKKKLELCVESWENVH